MNYEFQDITGFSSWIKITPVNKGYSNDKKYLIKTIHDETMLLRISDFKHYEEKKKEYELMCKCAALGFPMSIPLEFGTCCHNKNVYMIVSWLDGCDLEEKMGELSEEEQYRLGRQAGNILKKIHSIPVNKSDVPAFKKTEQKLKELQEYENSVLRVPDDEFAIQYIRKNIHKIERNTFVYLHGDFHPINLIYMPDGNLGVIDFNRWEIGDPYEDFYKLECFAVQLSIPYCIGQLDAYFGSKVPFEFWEVLAVYVAQATLYYIKWAEEFGQEEINVMVERWQIARKDYSQFRQIIPKWYAERNQNPQNSILNSCYS